MNFKVGDVVRIKRDITDYDYSIYNNLLEVVGRTSINSLQAKVSLMTRVKGGFTIIDANFNHLELVVPSKYWNGLKEMIDD